MSPNTGEIGKGRTQPSHIPHSYLRVDRNKERVGKHVLIISEDKIVGKILPFAQKGKIKGLFCKMISMIFDKDNGGPVV
jgi:hypothetical protein